MTICGGCIDACPAKGHIGVFNRSHYEDVLVVKVEKLAAADAIERRYDEINAFEKLIANSGTRILKFMLNVSKEEQAVRLQERVDDPTKQWKFKAERSGHAGQVGGLHGGL